MSKIDGQASIACTLWWMTAERGVVGDFYGRYENLNSSPFRGRLNLCWQVIIQTHWNSWFQSCALHWSGCVSACTYVCIISGPCAGACAMELVIFPFNQFQRLTSCICRRASLGNQKWVQVVQNSPQLHTYLSSLSFPFKWFASSKNLQNFLWLQTKKLFFFSHFFAIVKIAPKWKYLFAKRSEYMPP